MAALLSNSTVQGDTRSIKPAQKKNLNLKFKAENLSVKRQIFDLKIIFIALFLEVLWFKRKHTNMYI